MSRPLLKLPRLVGTRVYTPVQRLHTTSVVFDSQDSTPGWTGRGTEDHAVKRSGKDAQSDPSQQAMKDHQEGKEGSGAISRKDEGDHNKKAKEDHPEAPGPVIGMNDERGGKGH